MVLKKPSYPLTQPLLSYLERYERISKVSVFYDDLLRFSGSINVYDKNDTDTLWIRVYYCVWIDGFKYAFEKIRKVHI